MIDMETLGSEVANGLWTNVLYEEELQVLVVHRVKYLWLSDGIEGCKGVPVTDSV